MLSCIASTDPDTWLRPDEVLEMSSVAGAKANGYRDVGRIAVGQRGDIVLIDPNSFGLIPRNDAASQVVFSVRSRDVKHVFVDGELVVEDGVCATVDVPAVNARVAEAAERFWGEAEADQTENTRLLPGVLHAYHQAVSELGHDGLYRLIPPVPSSRDNLAQDRRAR